MENKERELEEKIYQGSLLAVMHFLSGIAAMMYSVFLFMNYSRNIPLGSLLTLGILLLYLWSLYASISRYKEGSLSAARGTFYAIGGLFLGFFLNIFVCLNSIRFG